MKPFTVWLPELSRVVVVSDEGEVVDLYHLYGDGAELQLQDRGRTLKIFPTVREEGVR